MLVNDSTTLGTGTNFCLKLVLPSIPLSIMIKLFIAYYGSFYRCANLNDESDDEIFKLIDAVFFECYQRLWQQ